MSTYHKIIAGLLVPILAASICLTASAEAVENDTPLQEQTKAESQGVIEYEDYLKAYSDKELANTSFSITVKNNHYLSNAEKQTIEDKEVVLIKDGGLADFKFNVEKAGLYNLRLCYFNVEGGGSNINLEWSIDGDVPFRELKYHVLYRRWQDEYLPGDKKDSRGNDILPVQVEENIFQEVYVSDTSGVYSEPYLIYFEAGEHTIRLTSKREAVAVESITLCNKQELKAYSELEKEYKEKGYTDYEKLLTFEAEHISAKSDSTLYALTDKASPASTPYSVDSVVYNTVGGSAFSTQGQWLEWEFEVSESALYALSFRVRQNYLSGSYVSRRIYVDGVVPCEEFNDIHISYSSNWQHITLPKIYLEKGKKHTIRMEVSVGDMSEIIAAIDKAASELNRAYSKIIMITTTNPDTYRTYDLPENAPEVFETFKEQLKVLQECNAQMIEKTGKRGSMNAILQSFSKQLEEFIKDPDRVQKNLSTYKTNISSLSSWVTQMKSQPLEIEKLYVGNDELLPKAEKGFFAKIWHEIRCFFASFYVDYNTIGEGVEDDNAAIEVWVQAGRDQANIIKNLVTASFESENCGGVDVKLVQGQLLSATASGRGPDVAMQVAASDPVNYATRGAAYDLSKFADFKTVAAQFRESALVPYEFNGGTYALPETQTFQVMFCRDDILAELELETPKTWDELFVVLGRLQKKNMTVGIQSSINTMTMLLYQRGGQLYTDNNSKSGLSSVEAQDAFKQWVSLYTDYSAPVSYNALDRFRTGEMPIIIEDFGFFNTLQASAPEIQGTWSFTSVPSTVAEDGSLSSIAVGGGISCMMLADCKNPDGAWDFMKWWTSTDTQTLYGREIENRLGASARYASANIKAFNNMPWSVNEISILNSLWGNVRAIPEVAGGYFTGRHLNNAFRRVINYGEDEKLTLLSYVDSIDDEIASKRNELGIK